MKSEKVCISKSIAFIATIVVVLLGVVLFANYMNSQNLAGNSRAAGECYYTYDQKRYAIPDGTCVKDVITQWTSTTLKCTSGNVLPDNTCITPAKPVCLYGGQEVGAQGSAYGMNPNTYCVLDVNGDAFGYRCKTVKDKQGNESVAPGRNSAYSDTVNCKGKAADAVCLYGNEDVNKSTVYSMDGSTFCILENNKPIEYRCKTVKDDQGASVLPAGRNAAVQDRSCRDTTPAPAVCLYGGEVVGAQNGSYKMDASYCVLNASGEKFGVRCRTVKDNQGNETMAAGRNSAYTDNVNCKGKPAAAACLYGGEVVGAANGSYGMDSASFCILNKDGNPFGLRCKTVKDSQGKEVLADGRNSAYSNTVCAPKCSQQNCGTVKYGTCDAKNEQMCTCQNPDSTTERPQLLVTSNCP